MTDKQIVREIKNGNEGAFKELVEKNQEMIINACNSFVHNREDAMDIAQEVFIKAYNSIHKFQGKSKLSSWLYRIAVNNSLNFIRDYKRKNILSSLDLLFENSTDISDKIEDDTDNKEKSFENEEMRAALKKSVGELPKKQKVALTLNKFEELSYKEIAEVMEISVSETGVLINRAKKQLQKKLIKKAENQ
ncbi:MAG: RNA polymerase sigma factor [Bacteroidota bacterium]